jgi:hypothetical protein
MWKRAVRRNIIAMTTTDYILDSALVLLVILQMKERVLTNRALIRPLIIVAVAVVSYFKTFPTAGNDIALIIVISLIGATLGVLSGVTVKMRRNDEGRITARAGTASALLWVLGMGSRFAFIYWLTHFGSSTITHFSVVHHITSMEAWTVALLGMAVSEVVARTAVMAGRRSQLSAPRPALAIA